VLSCRGSDSIEPESGDKAVDNLTIAIVVGVVFGLVVFALISGFIVRKKGGGG
jgi:hypothetical protein